MDTIQGLLQTRAEKIKISEDALKDAEAIDRVLTILGYDRDDANTLPVSEAKVETGFPKRADKKEQVIWMFNNVLNKPLRNPEFVAKYEELSGLKKHNIITHLKRLVNANALRGVKYNNQNTLTYYGKVDWIANGDFKTEHYPEGLDPGLYSTKLIDKAIGTGK